MFKRLLAGGIIYVGIWRRVARVVGWLVARFELKTLCALAVGLALPGCGEEGLLPTTVDPGANFSVADVRFDEGFYYCRVEPVLFAQKCGPGDPAQGDAGNGCHHNVTSYRLTAYAPLVAEQCGAGVVPSTSSFPNAAQQNYQSSQSRMKRDPDLAPLLQRPTGRATHPRIIFDLASSDADVIRQWATQYSTQ